MLRLVLERASRVWQEGEAVRASASGGEFKEYVWSGCRFLLEIVLALWMGPQRAEGDRSHPSWDEGSPAYFALRLYCL